MPAVPTLGVILKYAALRQCVAETIWTVYVTEPSYGLYVNF